MISKAYIWGFVVLFITVLSSCTTTDSLEQRPNIIYILADDLGYGELGIYGQEKIMTPHLDELAKSGMVFTQHYSGAPVCAPSRCVLLTGQHTGHAYVRGNDEWGARGKVWDYQAMYDNPFLEGQRPLPDSIITIAEVLQESGYTTGMVGKWGLGAPTTEGVPNNQGFDFFYGYNCQRQAHTYYPMHLWKNDQRDLLDNKFVPLHANLKPDVDPNEISSYSDFNLEEFAPDLMHQEALSFMERNKTKPFFLYYASPIPHLPLQAPQRWIDHYVELWGDEEPFTGTSYFPCRYPRATYAAMISYLDEQVGELVEALRQMGQLENTIIIFSSDNGPTYTGGADTPFFDSAKPFRTERGWGKGFVHEGGIRVPMIASWPGRIPQGSKSDHISAFHDVFPTICEIAGVSVPDGIDGISFLPELTKQEQEKHEFLFWDFPEYGGQQAVRMGDWKAIRRNIRNGNMEIELYDLSRDPREENNIAEDHPDMVKKISDLMKTERTEPAIDRFKMEVLGDVLNSVIEARARMNQLEALNVQTEEEYFTISRRTVISGSEELLNEFDILQQLFRTTGGYSLSESQNATNQSINLANDKGLSESQFKIDINKEVINISVGSTAGMQKAMNAIVELMDPKFSESHLMHNPTWVIAGGTIKNF